MQTVTVTDDEAAVALSIDLAPALPLAFDKYWERLIVHPGTGLAILKRLVRVRCCSMDTVLGLDTKKNPLLGFIARDVANFTRHGEFINPGRIVLFPKAIGPFKDEYYCTHVFLREGRTVRFFGTLSLRDWPHTKFMFA
ncbi:MAG: hypothetical protein PHV93_02385 [Candidatus Pacebacteria bacterium]|nr:hypothetical protein [Candidatus Paceibacterota bacterium]